jgi:hypothetical protein
MMMRFYASRSADGLIHVTNAIGGMVGQHHVHDEASWASWRAGNPEHGIGPVADADIEWLAGVTDCACGSPIWGRSP